MRIGATQYRLGLVMFGLLPFLAGLKGLMIPANVTIMIPVAAIAVFATGRWTELGRMTLPDLSMIALCVFLICRSLLDLNEIFRQPAEFSMHLASLLLICPMMYYVGRVAASGMSDRDAQRLLSINLTIVLVFLVISVAAPDFAKRNGLEANSYYQYMGDGLAVAALTAWACNYRPRFYWPYLLTAVLLVSIGSRASAVAYITAMAFSNVRLVVTGAIVAAPAGLWLLSAIERGAGLDWAGQFRVLSTFLDVFVQDAEDASLSERQLYFDNAINVIQQRPLLGEMAYELHYGGLGEFVHNILHLWANFGLPAFVLMLLVMFGAPASKFLLSPERSSLSPTPLFIFLATEFLFFRHPENVVLFFALGVMVSLYMTRSSASSAPYARTIVHAQ